jgi:hypothetical protein
MGNIRQFYPNRMTVGHDDGFGHLVDLFDADGFRCELEEDDSVIWELYGTNGGTTDVFAVYCKPFTTGPWQIIDRMRVAVGANSSLIRTWRADNEDHFFFYEYGDGRAITGGNSNCEWSTNNDTQADMVWHVPYLYLALRRK